MCVFAEDGAAAARVPVGPHRVPDRQCARSWWKPADGTKTNPKGISVRKDWEGMGHIVWKPIFGRGEPCRLADFEGLAWFAGFWGFGVRGGLAVWRILRVWRDLLNWMSSVYPPLGGLLFLVGNPYMILYVYITIISGRNKYLKISKSRQKRLASQAIQRSCKDTW